MTVKKAIAILDWWINQKKESIKLLKEDFFESDSVSDLSKSLIKYDESAIYNIEKIKAEFVPKCKHPKKMIDTLPDGQKYYMNCNLDL